MHDFIIPELGRAVPYGVYDIADNTGWVSVGIDHDTAAFAVNAIRRWWKRWAASVIPTPRSLLITADGGGSNGSRVRLWKSSCSSWPTNSAFPSPCALPARHQQVEQDRAPPVLVHHRQLARQTARQPPGHRRSDRRNYDEAGLSVRCQLDRTPTPGSPCPMMRWMPSTSHATSSTANGITPSAQKHSLYIR